MNAKKHWTSMFIKSNSSTSSSNQLAETSDSSATRLPYSELDETTHNYGLEGETNQPKGRTRWNPKPEQIRILEAIFQSGMVSPPREEIKRIRAQLEVFGQVGDANVYYWFQNRKARSKRKPRLPAAQRSKSRTQSGTLSSTSSTSTSTSTSVQSKTATEISNCPPNSMQRNIGNQYCSPSPVPVSSFAGNHYDIPAVYEEMSKISSAPSSSPPIGDQYCFSSVGPVYSSAGNHYNLRTSASVPYETLPNPSNCPPSAMLTHIGDQYCFSSAAPIDSSAGPHNDLRTMSYDIQAIGAAAAGSQRILNEGMGGVQDGSVINPNPSIRVFINDVPTSVPSGPVNLRDFFGADAFLFHSSGESVLVNEFGFASLDAGATYFLI